MGREREGIRGCRDCCRPPCAVPSLHQKRVGGFSLLGPFLVPDTGFSRFLVCSLVFLVFDADGMPWLVAEFAVKGAGFP